MFDKLLYATLSAAALAATFTISMIGWKEYHGIQERIDVDKLQDEWERVNRRSLAAELRYANLKDYSKGQDIILNSHQEIIKDLMVKVANLEKRPCQPQARVVEVPGVMPGREEDLFIPKPIPPIPIP